MAVSYGTTSNTTYALRTNTVVTAPTDIANGNELYYALFLGAGGGYPSAPTAPTDFSAAEGSPIEANAGGFYARFYLWRKIASGESGDYTATHANAYSQGAMYRVSGSNEGTPVVSVNTGTGTTSTGLSIETVANNSLVVWIGCDWADTANNLTPPSGTTPTFSEHLDVTLTYIASGVLASAGATGNKTMTNNATGSNPWMVYMVGIAPGGVSAKRSVLAGLLARRALCQ